MSADVTSRAEALQTIVAIARQHALSPADVAQALDGAPPPDGARRTVMVRALGYLGGTFVFAGVAVFIALQWDSMNAAARVVITLGSGVAAVVLGVLATRDRRFDKAGTPLLLMAAALEPTGMLVAFDEFGSGGEWRWAALITCGVMALQFGALFTVLRRATPLFLIVLFGALFWWTAFDLLGADEDVTAMLLGATLLMASVGIDRVGYGGVTPVWYFTGAALSLYGLFEIVEGSPLEIAFLVVASAFVYLSAALHSRAVLVVATAAILAYTGWFTSEHFADSIGWPLALVAFGLFMIAMSALAFRVDRAYVREKR